MLRLIHTALEKLRKRNSVVTVEYGPIPDLGARRTAAACAIALSISLVAGLAGEYFVAAVGLAAALALYLRYRSREWIEIPAGAPRGRVGCRPRRRKGRRRARPQLKYVCYEHGILTRDEVFFDEVGGAPMVRCIYCGSVCRVRRGKRR